VSDGYPADDLTRRFTAISLRFRPQRGRRTQFAGLRRRQTPTHRLQRRWCVIRSTSDVPFVSQERRDFNRPRPSRMLADRR